MHKIVNIGLLLLLAFIFFFRIDYTALESYDEAWYAAIARNIVSNRNPFILEFNDTHFQDHPPLGYIFMAIPTAIGGSNEFTARFASAFFGIGSIVLIYLIGKKIKNSFVGISSGAILLSSLWFMYRARSGNLDTQFFFWTVFIFFCLINLHNSKKYFYLLVAGFSAALLTKTLIGLGMLPVIAYYFWHEREKINFKSIFCLLAMFILLISPWYIYHQVIDPSFLQHHFIEIGTRGTNTIYSLTNLLRSSYYLQVGLGRWWKVFLFSIPLNLILWTRLKTIIKHWLALWIWLISFALPLMTASTVEVWHLLPLYAPLSLLISVVFFEWVEIIKGRYFSLSLLIGILVLAFVQFYQSANLLYLSQPRYSAEKQISLNARNYSPIFTMTHFYPAAVYYSQEKVIPLMHKPNSYQSMLDLLEKNKGVFIADQKIINDLQRDSVDVFILSQEGDYYLIKHDSPQTQ